MRAQLHKLPTDGTTSFLYMQWECDHFDKPWHFHKEYELVLIEKSTGTKFIGDSISHFHDGDLTLIGSNVPHLFRNDETYYEADSSLKASSIFIHFTDTFLGDGFFSIPELKSVCRLLQQASLALEIGGKAKKYTIQRLQEMQCETPGRRLVSLLDILVSLAESDGLTPLLSRSFLTTNSSDASKINKAFEFILQNYTEEIYIGDLATKLNMSVASFSRYFKHHTRKTFSECVTEIRIGHACRLLIEDDLSISEISYKVGFDNLSNFYRHFRKITDMVPRDYKNRFIKGNS